MLHSIVAPEKAMSHALLAGFTAVVASIAVADELQSDEAVTRASEAAALRGVLTAEQQAALTPELVLEQLLAGNGRFVADDLTQRNHSQRVREAYAGQFPKAVILSCLDSRIPVEDVFDLGIGDLFVARVAGNFVNEDILGSMEFGCHVAGAKLIMVIGHTHCGAVQAAIDDVQLGNITPMLAKIRPAIEQGLSTEKRPAKTPPMSPMSVGRMSALRWQPSASGARSSRRWRPTERSRLWEPTTTSAVARSRSCPEPWPLGAAERSPA
jgi:carbonic anhydrase